MNALFLVLIQKGKLKITKFVFLFVKNFNQINYDVQKCVHKVFIIGENQTKNANFLNNPSNSVF